MHIPKAHGCVTANFIVDDQLSEQLAQGIFNVGARYQSLIRFSNGNEDPDRSDALGDGRGMAIKILGQTEDALVPESDGSFSQDFIMISNPTFIVGEGRDYLALIETVNSNSGGFLSFLKPLTIPFKIGLKGTVIAAKTTSKKIDNPLNTRYWSMVPYQLGLGKNRQAIKFSARPCNATGVNIPDDAPNNFLRNVLRERLKTQPACMEFLVQLRTSDRLSVEDPQQEWLEADAPFHRVAVLEIPAQNFDTPEQNAICEALSFSPWHALPAHKPLGAVNRMRKVIYQQISELRRSRRQEQR